MGIGIILLILIGLIAVVLLWVAGAYNGLVAHYDKK